MVLVSLAGADVLVAVGTGVLVTVADTGVLGGKGIAVRLSESAVFVGRLFLLLQYEEVDQANIKNDETRPMWASVTPLRMALTR